MATIAPQSASTHDREDRARVYFSTPRRYLRGNYRVALRAEIAAEILAGMDLGDMIDLGCGDGAIAERLAPAARSLTLVDTSRDMLTEAERKLGASARYECRDLHQPDGRTFDTALCIGVLAHVDSTDRVLRAIAEAVRPGGHLLLQLSDHAKSVTQLNMALTALRHRLTYRATVLGPVISAAHRRGFELVEVRRHLIVPAGVQRLLGPLLLPIERFVMKSPLRHHAGDAMLLLRRIT
jgi:2-polyprenyl-3-methyl-5-hydroxy-6-metoxy-1,4-benzoquinol methylase